MAVFDLYSKRKKRLEQAGSADIYRYDDLPQPFRVQVAHIWRGAIGPWIDTSRSYGFNPECRSNEHWEFILNGMLREKGLFRLIDQKANPVAQCVGYLMGADPIDALDIIELSFGVIDRDVRSDLVAVYNAQTPDEAVSELNDRFREHSIGYQYTNGFIIRVDNQFIHAESVKPALQLLSAAGFEGPNDEFLRAYEHYRNGRNKEAVAEALKAFESTIKAICRKRGWRHSPNATAKPLLDTLFEKGLVPAELQAHFGALRSAMESGLPTLSNRTSRHGQGPEPYTVPRCWVEYALHLCAANIVFLVEANNAIEQGLAPPR